MLVDDRLSLMGGLEGFTLARPHLREFRDDVVRVARNRDEGAAIGLVLDLPGRTDELESASRRCRLTQLRRVALAAWS